MSNDWEVGDLALCVAALPCDICGFCSDELRVGNTYQVEGVEQAMGFLWLFIPSIGQTEHEHWSDDPWYLADQFCKIRPDEHEDCEPEFVTLLESFKPVPADLAREELR